MRLMLSEVVGFGGNGSGCLCIMCSLVSLVGVLLS